MSSNWQTEQRWEACPPGTVHQLRRRLRRRQQRRTAAQAVTASALVLLAIGGLWQVGRTVLDGPREYHIAGLWCSEVEQHAQALMAGQERDAELLEHMSDHIDHCPHCGPKFEHMDLPVGWLGPVPAEPVLKYASLAGRRFWSVIASVPVYPAH